MRITKGFIGLTLMVCTCWAQQEKPSGRISGIVTDNGGQAVSGAFVMAALQPESAAASYTPFATTAFTTADGSYKLQDLPLGSYKLCVEHRTAQVLNPCTWSNDPIMARLTVSQPSAETAIKVNKGGLLTVQFDDKAELFSKNQKSANAHILIGTNYGTSGVVSASAAANSDAAREVTLLLPYDTPADITVYSGFFKLADANGTEFKDRAFKIPVSVKATSGTDKQSSSANRIVLQVVAAGS